MGRRCQRRRPWVHAQARKGDEAFIYHTGNEKAIVGLAQIVTDPYEDPAEPGLNGKGEMKSPLFDIKPLRAARTPVTLAQVKADPRFKNFELVRIAPGRDAGAGEARRRPSQDGGAVSDVLRRP